MTLLLPYLITTIPLQILNHFSYVNVINFTNFLVRWLFRSWKQCGKLNWDIKIWRFSKLKLEQPCRMLISCLDENSYVKFLELNLKKPHWIVISLVVNENSYVKLALKLKPHWILMYINHWKFIPLNSKTSIETFTIIKTSFTIIGKIWYHNLGFLKLKKSLNSKMGLLPHVKEKKIIVKNGKPHFIYNNKTRNWMNRF
jgi:hypothetical protein